MADTRRGKQLGGTLRKVDFYEYSPEGGQKELYTIVVHETMMGGGGEARFFAYLQGSSPRSRKASASGDTLERALSACLEKLMAGAAENS